MNHSSKRTLQIPALLGLILLLLNMGMMELEVPSQPEAISRALQWNGFGALAPVSILVAAWWISTIVMIVGVIGFALFQNWARYALLVLIFALLALIPFQGLYVNTATHECLFLLGNLLIVAPLVFSFSPSCNAYFTKTVEPRGSAD